MRCYEKVDPAKLHSNHLSCLRVPAVLHISCSASLLRRQVQLQNASMLPLSVAPLESSCQPCKARLPSQPPSVSSIVFIDCCSTANYNPLIEPFFLPCSHLSSVTTSLNFQIWTLANVFCTIQLPRVLDMCLSLSSNFAVREPLGPQVSISSATPDRHHDIPHMVLSFCHVALTSLSVLSME